MHLTSLLATALLATTAVARNPFTDYYCPLATDKSKMVQQPYCCSDLVPARYNDQAMSGDKCMAFLSYYSSCLRAMNRTMLTGVFSYEYRRATR